MIKNQQLSKDYWLHDFLVSETYPDLARELNPNPYQVDTLRLLCESILQPTWNRWGGLGQESGFRNDRLNRLVGGSATSDHRLAAADDFSRAKGLMRVYLWMRWSHLPYRQLIWYKRKHIIHVSINTPGKAFKHEQWVQT